MLLTYLVCVTMELAWYVVNGFEYAMSMSAAAGGGKFVHTNYHTVAKYPNPNLLICSASQTIIITKYDGLT